MLIPSRFLSAFRIACIHLMGSLAVATATGFLVFKLLYPFPYGELSGGHELFLLLVAIDVICGPLLTMVVFNPAKPRVELWRDLALVVAMQITALGYGFWTLFEARPIFLVQEIDRFKVIAKPDLQDISLAKLPADLQPHWWAGPLTVAIREPKDIEEKNKVMLESVSGGRDYAERPEFYIPYQDKAASKSLKHARLLTVFLGKYPSQRNEAERLAELKGVQLPQLMYLPIQARRNWIAVIDRQGEIQGFLQGDGFQVD